jgi:hypothetical protein
MHKYGNIVKIVEWPIMRNFAVGLRLIDRLHA